MDFIFEASLPLLISKVILIFIITWLTGFSVRYAKFSSEPLTDWFQTTSVGCSILLISILWSSILSLPGKYGLILPFLLFIIKLFKIDYKKIQFESKTFFIISIIISLGSLNYLLPFLLKFTSGYYSRGGGDHSSYLSLSEWILSNGYWIKFPKEMILPDYPNWMVNRFIQGAQNLWKFGPVADQFMAAPYMQILPGRVEETYTASVAFYATMAGFSFASLFGIISKLDIRKLFLISILILISPMLAYIATSHSIPFLYSIFIMNGCLILIVERIRDEDWGLITSLPLMILAGSLLLFYPHLYIMGFAFAGIIILCLYKKIISIKLLKYISIIIIASFIITNIFLQVSIPLVFMTSSSNLGGAALYTWKQILISWIGIDFGFWVSSADYIFNAKQNILIIYVIFPLIFVFTFFSFKSIAVREKFVLFLIPFILISASLFYNSKNFSYQAIRFTEIGHGYLIALFSLGILNAYSYKNKIIKIFALSSFLVVACYFCYIRNLSVKEIIKPKTNTITEFRTTEDLRFADSVFEVQKKYPANEGLVYYFGKGNGVEVAGISILFRKLRYLLSYGIDYNIMTYLAEKQDKFIMWDKKYLKNAILVFQNTYNEGSIIEDARIDSDSIQSDATTKFKMIQTENTQIATLIGSYWHVPVKYDSNSEYKYFRYLKNEPGAIIIWSKKDEVVKIEMLMHSDSENASVEFSGEPFQIAKTFKLEKWENKFSEKNKINIVANLKQGANMILLNRKLPKEGVAWIMLWKVRIY